jgi:hypothetical protein
MSGTRFESSNGTVAGDVTAVPEGKMAPEVDTWGLFDNVRHDVLMSGDRDPVSGRPTPRPTTTERRKSLFPEKPELPMMFYFVTS